MRVTVITAMVALLGLPLAACGSSSSTSSADMPACPRVAILADGADLTRFRAGAARDLTAMTLDARIAGFNVQCSYADRRRRVVDVRVTPRFEAERGPANTERSAELPWFVALSDAQDSAVLERVTGNTRITFASNVPRAEATGRPVQVSVPIGGDLRAGDYLLRLSFQLSRDELELNRSRGAR